MAWPDSTKIKPGEVRNPKGRGHSKDKTPFDQLQAGIVELIKIPLSVLGTIEEKQEVRNKLNESMRKDPFRYVAKILIPILRTLPPPTIIQIFAEITNAAEEGEVAQELRGIRLALENATEKGVSLDNAREIIESRLERARSN